MVALDPVAFMLASMETQFAPLTESLRTPVYATFVGLLISVNAFMLLPILVKREPLVAEPASVLLHLAVDQLMPREREPCRKDCLALGTLINCFVLHEF